MAPCSGFYCLNNAQQTGAIFCIVTTIVILALVYWYVVLRKRPQHAQDDPEWEMVRIRRRRNPTPQPTTPLPRPSKSRFWGKFMEHMRGKKDNSTPDPSTRSEHRAAATQTEPPGLFQHPVQVQRPPPVAQPPFVTHPPPPPPPPGAGTLGLQQAQGQMNTGHPGPVLFSSTAPFGNGPHVMHGHPILLQPLPVCPSVPPVIPQSRPTPHQMPPVNTPKRSFWSRFTRDHRPISHPPPGRASTLLSTPSTRASRDNSRSRSRSLSRGRTLERSSSVYGTKRKSRNPAGQQCTPRRANRQEHSRDNISADKIVPPRRQDAQMGTPVLPKASDGHKPQATSQPRPARDASPPDRRAAGRRLPSTESLRPSTPSYPASSVSEDHPREEGATIGQRLAQLVPQALQAQGKAAEKQPEVRNSRHGLPRSQERVYGGQGDERRKVAQDDDEPRMVYENRHGPYRHDGVIPDGQAVRPHPTPARDHNQADNQSVHSDAETYRSLSSGMVAEAGSDYSDARPTRRTNGRKKQEKREE